MEQIKNLNLALKFFLELSMLAALAYAGFHITHDRNLHWLIGICSPLAAAVIWGIYMAPKASRRLKRAQRVVVEIVLFGAAGAGLLNSGKILLGLVFLLAFVINDVLLLVWEQ